ncbi:MAG TPA: hypothetical protein VGG38_15030 [Acidimicrobiales bacterium]
MTTDATAEHLRELDPVTVGPDELSGEDRLVLARILTQPRSAPSHRAPMSSRPGWKVPLAAAAVIVVAALLSLQLSTGSGPGTPKASAPGWRLVGFSSTPFRDLGTGQGQPGLQCMTDQICYAPGSGFPSDLIYKTVDGGQQWSPLAPFPTADKAALADLPLGQNFECSSATVCFIVAGTAGILLTADGGSSWTSIAPPVSTGEMGQAWCADTQHCVISEVDSATHSLSALATTVDGGTNWVTQPAPPGGGGPWELQCDLTGRCLALTQVQTTGTFLTSVVALSSPSWGAAWTAGQPASIGRVAILYHSCADATDCMLVGINASYVIATTSNGGQTWQVSAPPAGWLNMPTAVGCAGQGACWIAMSLYDTKSPDGSYSHPVIESTTDMGQTWTPLSLPQTTPATADVLTLSCPPSGDGCMAIGNGKDHFVLPPGPPHQLSGPILLSNLP